MLDFAKSFAAGRLPAAVFAGAYAELWRIERDRNLLGNDEPGLSACLSGILNVARHYNPDPGRSPQEFGEAELSARVRDLIDTLNSY